MFHRWNGRQPGHTGKQPAGRRSLPTGANRRRQLLALGAWLSACTLPRPALAAPDYDDPDQMYAALHAGKAQTLSVPGGVIRLVFAEEAGALDRAAVLAWVRNAAQALSTYFGRFPVEQYGLLVVAQPGDQVGHATTYGYAGAATRIGVGLQARGEAFARDWVLVHEMVHTALPDLPRRALWLQEGNATWIEPVARAQAGQLPAEEVWREAVAGMPKGMADPGEGGMDGTRRWGRLYWGGASFWLMAEIAIHEATGGRHTLRDAMQYMNRESGGTTARWTPEHLMEVGDLATGSQALASLYRQFSTTTVRPDLPALFARLGVVPQGDGTIRLDESAPLAALRRRITEARPAD